MMSDEQSGGGRRRRRRRGRGGRGARPRTPAPSAAAVPVLPRPDRHQRLAVFQAAVAAHTAGLDDAELDIVLRRAMYHLERASTQMRHTTDTIPVPRHLLEDLARERETILDALRDGPRIESWQYESLDRAIEDLVPWDGIEEP